MSVLTAEDAREQVMTPPIYRGEQVVCTFSLPAGVTFTPGATGLRFAIGTVGETPVVEVTDVASPDGVVEIVNTTDVQVTIEEEASATIAEGRPKWTLYGTVSGQPKVWAAGTWPVRKGAGTVPGP